MRNLVYWFLTRGETSGQLCLFQRSVGINDDCSLIKGCPLTKGRSDMAVGLDFFEQNEQGGLALGLRSIMCVLKNHLYLKHL